MSQVFDAIVLGAGAMGSAAAYYLSKAGQRVLLLEQFDIDHQLGSSYGYSRIIRYAYDNPIYVTLMKSAYQLWFDLQAVSGEQLYFKTGGIDFGFAETDTLQDTIKSLHDCDIPYELLTPQEAQKRFPQFQFKDGMQIVYQGDSGAVKASDSVLTHIRMAKKHGARVIDNAPVENVKVEANQVEVNANGETYTAAKLVITAGSWAKSILGELGLNLPLRPMLCQLNFFTPENLAQYEIGSLPIFIGHVQSEFNDFVYGIPGKDGVELKVALHGGSWVDDMATLDRTPSDVVVETVRGFNRQYVPEADAPLNTYRTCLYTMTPDEHFIIDKHPEHGHVVFGAGFSGHGFKFSTLIGSILSDLALTGETQHDISLFKADRF